MITRSDIRHALYRKKTGGAAKQELIDLVEPKLPTGATWDNFADKWDVLLTKDRDVVIITPEINYDYIHSICLEVALCKRKDLELELDDRANNVYQIVELNMLDNMKWEDYNKTWGVYIDHELKRVHTKHFKTSQNVVTNEMIQASRPGSGEKMVEMPSIPVFQVEMEPFEPTPAEKAMLTSLTKKKLTNK